MKQGFLFSSEKKIPRCVRECTGKISLVQILQIGLYITLLCNMKSSLTEFLKKCSDHFRSGRVVRSCANLKNGTIKSGCPTLKIRCPAHLKISFCSREGKKFISTNFAKNGVIEPFLDADTTSGFK